MDLENRIKLIEHIRNLCLSGLETDDPIRMHKCFKEIMTAAGLPEQEKQLPTG